MVKFLIAGIFLITIKCHASLELYTVGHLGFMPQKSNEKFVNFEKYGLGIGLQYSPVSFFSVGGELEYTRGDSNDPKPYVMAKEISPATYGGFNHKGIIFVHVHYLELWFRPKFIVSIPFVEPYLVLPLSPLSFGGMQGYPSYGVGLGALLGIQTTINSLSLFVEAGTIMRARKGKPEDIRQPPWGMYDFTLPLRIGIGYSF